MVSIGIIDAAHSVGAQPPRGCVAWEAVYPTAEAVGFLHAALSGLSLPCDVLPMLSLRRSCRCGILLPLLLPV